MHGLTPFPFQKAQAENLEKVTLEQWGGIMGRNMFTKSLSIKNFLFLFGNKKAIGLSIILAVIPIAISLTLGAPPLLEYSVSGKEIVMGYLCLTTAFYPDTVCELVLPRGLWSPLLYDPGKTGSTAPMNPKWFTYKNWVTYYYFAWYFLIWQLTISPIIRLYTWFKHRLIPNKE